MLRKITVKIELERMGIHKCYKMKKYRKRFPYILVEKHYFISLQEEREGT